VHKITLAEVNTAHNVFIAHETRDVFYRVAMEILALARKQETTLSVAEALAVLLLTWNANYYKFKKHKFDNEHLANIENLLQTHKKALAGYKDRIIDDVDSVEAPAISQMFESFEDVLGHVGAAKALHLLAPEFFPLWDTRIATAYRLRLRPRPAKNGDLYWRFVAEARDQCLDLKRQGPALAHPLKLIDEFNYCKHVKDWL
jgi:hypothetical protein